MNTLTSIVFTILFLVFTTCILSQTNQKTTHAVLKIKLHDGSTFYGSITDRDKETVTLRTIWMRDAVIYQSDIEEITVSPLSAEELLKTVEITIIDTQNSLFRGRILEATFDTLRFETSGGIQVAVPQQKIKRISTTSISKDNVQTEVVDPVRTHKYFLKDKLFLNSTGIMPAPGDVYLGVYYMLVPTVTIGVHNNASVLLGMSLLPGSEDQLFVFNPRVGIYQSENAGIAVSYLLASVTTDNEPFHSFMLNSTYGNENIQGTFGIGIGYVDGGFTDSPWFALGGTFRLSNSVKLITENHFYSYSDVVSGVMSFGFRFYGENVAGDLAFLRPFIEDFSIRGWPFFPLVTLFYKF